MLPPDAQRTLRKARAAQRRLRSNSRTLTVVAIGIAARLAIDAAILFEWISEYDTAREAWGGALLFGFVGVLIAVATSRFPRETDEHAARRVDAALPALGESLDALVYLEQREHEPFVGSYATRIRQRVARVLLDNKVPFLYSRERRRMRMLLAACAVGVFAVVHLEQWTDPWGGLKAVAQLDDVMDALEAPDSAVPEVISEWGEVRITEPGRDLRVTKVDVVSLEIEAATSGELVEAQWWTAKSGEADVSHSLPEPANRHHALFAPHLYVDELRLSDWDVVAYHAGAATASGGELSSRIYFLEIRPFREEILKLGEGDATRRKAFALLGEVSGLIDRQKHVVRETHHHLRQPRRRADDQRSDREKLRDAEEKVLEASEHLYGRVAAEMENQPVAEVLDHLALAQTDLAEAVAALREAGGRPLVPEQSALRHLIATRKAFHQAISEGGSGGGDGSGEDDEPLGPVAGLEDQLREMAELRDERSAVREEVQDLLEAQRRLAENVERATDAEKPAHAEEQDSLREHLVDLAELHPHPFVRSRVALDAALDAMAAASDDLQAAEASGASQQHAVTRLEALHASLEAEARRGDLTAGYELRQALERARERLRSLEADPSSVADDEVRELAEETRSAARALDDAVPGGLAGLAGLESALAALEEAPGGAARSQSARDARQALDEIEAELDRRTPELVRRLRDHNPLEESPDEALDDALRQLRGLAEEGEGRELTPEEREQARRDILDGLAKGLTPLYGAAEAGSMLALVEEGLGGEGFDPERLRELVARIEHRRVEIRESEEREEDQRAVVHADPTRLAPAYRRRVEEYFRRLSER